MSRGPICGSEIKYYSRYFMLHYVSMIVFYCMPIIVLDLVLRSFTSFPVPPIDSPLAVQCSFKFLDAVPILFDT